MRRYLPFLIIGTVLLIAAGSGLLLFRSKSSIMPIKIAEGQPGAEPPHIRGATKARVTLEEFGDFQCPPCGNVAKTLLKVEHAYATRLRVIFREFPLGMHAHALTAARAAEAAGLQGRFWEMHDLLFQNAATWSKDSPRPRVPVPLRAEPSASPEETAGGVSAIFAGYAATIGLDVERFKKDMDAEEVGARIKSDQERAASVGVDRTPIVFIDGVQIPFSALLDEKELHRVIDAALSGKTSGPVPTPTPIPPK